MRWISSRVGAVAAAAAVAAVLAGGTYAFASATNTITVCVNHKSGALYKAKHCARRDSKLSWNKQGAAGAPGHVGAAATSLWASVENGGTAATILSSKGVTSIHRTAPGQVYVKFAQNVSACSFVATIGSNAGGYYPTPVTIQVAKGFYAGGFGQDGETVGVYTFNGSTFTDYDFSIAAYC